MDKEKYLNKWGRQKIELIRFIFPQLSKHSSLNIIHPSTCRDPSHFPNVFLETQEIDIPADYLKK